MIQLASFINNIHKITPFYISEYLNLVDKNSIVLHPYTQTIKSIAKTSKRKLAG